MAARLGARNAEIVTCVGNDGFGDETVRNFAVCGMGGAGVMRAPEPTGVAPIWVDGDGENRILIVNGANDCLLPAHVADGTTPTGRMVQQAKLVVCQLEINAETTLAALRNAKASGGVTILNPAPAKEKLAGAFYEHADIVAPNQSEAEILTGCSCDSIDGARAAARKLLECGAHCVVMTLGAKGCLISLGVGEADMAVVSAPSIPKSSVVDTSGAGDCFLGAFAYSLSQGADTQAELMHMDRLKEAALFACRAATLSVQGKGTQSSYPAKEDLL
jgi:ribokinase